MNRRSQNLEVRRAGACLLPAALAKELLEVGDALGGGALGGVEGEGLAVGAVVGVGVEVAEHGAELLGTGELHVRVGLEGNEVETRLEEDKANEEESRERERRIRRSRRRGEREKRSRR